MKALMIVLGCGLSSLQSLGRVDNLNAAIAQSYSEQARLIRELRASYGEGVQLDSRLAKTFDQLVKIDSKNEKDFKMTYVPVSKYTKRKTQP